MQFVKRSALVFVLGAFTACGGGHGGAPRNGAVDASNDGSTDGARDANETDTLPGDADGNAEAGPGDAGVDGGSSDGGITPLCGPPKLAYAPLFTGDAVSQTPIAFTDPSTGHLIFRGAGRFRMGHELEDSYATYPPQYFEDRTFGYVLDDAVAAGGTTITATLLPVANQYYHKQKLAPQQQGGFDMNFRYWKNYGTAAGNRFFGNLLGLDNPPAGCAADPDGAGCDTRKWTFTVTKNDRADRPMRAGDQLQVELNVALAEYGPGQGAPVDATHVRNLLPLPQSCTLNGPPFQNSCYTQSFYRATDSFRYVVGGGTLTPANEDCTIVVPLDVQDSPTGLPEPYDCSPTGNVGKAIAAGTLRDRLGPSAAGWSGGTATLPYLRSRHDLYFEQMAPSTLVENAESFVQGRFLFYLDFGTGQSTEPYHSLSEAEIAARAHLVGPRYAQASCVGCHVNNNRGAAPKAGAPLDAFRVRLADDSYDAHGRPSDALAGRALQTKAVGGAAEGSAVARSGGTITMNLADGTNVVLTKPSFDVAVPGEEHAVYSARIAPPLVGLGLLEAIADEDIVARADPADCNQDGVKGTPSIVYDDEDGMMKLGRFGWRATTASLRQAAAESLLLDLGVTTTVYPTDDCGAKQAGCAPSSGAKPELGDGDLARLVTYMRDGAVPPRRDLTDPAVMRGEELFGKLGCAACHTTTFTTGTSSPFLELRHQTIHPYSDLLLHDMGADLADNGFATEFAATKAMWRTPPLWGIGLCDEVAAGYAGPSYNQSPDLGPCHYLHDGRAATLLEAVLWHDGEARKSRSGVVALPADDRAALVAFLRSL
jgi:CxxC motif-containing protein (DUF1111 family)